MLVIYGSIRSLKYEDYMYEVKISVRTLVEFILREGDIDNRRTHGTDEAMQLGARIHRKIQKSEQAKGLDYHAEVPLSYTYCSDDLQITVDGRADGIIDADTVIVDEIKGTYRHLDKLEGPDNVHLAQARCYAFIYSYDNNLKNIEVQMTYVNMETEDIRKFNSVYTYEEISGWFMGLMAEYEKWARMEMEWKKTRDSSIHVTGFPYEYRKGQKELVTHVYHTFAHGKKLFLEAPTGVGKTIATVFPAVKAMGEAKANKIFYLTAKTITGTVADNTFELMRSKGLRFKSVWITAKDKSCFLEERICNPDACPYAKGHFDRINEALFAILTTEECYDREKIAEYAEKYMVCPFELALDISLFCDGIICDYNYLFDPHVYLKRFFAEGRKDEYIFLIDEAHNLVDRGRSMYSATLIKEDFLELKKKVKVYDSTLAKRLERCNHEMLALKRECDGVKKLENIDPFIIVLERLYSSVQSYLENHDSSPVRDDVLDFYFEISHFLYIYDLMDDKYVIYSYMLNNGNFGLRLFCVDPSTNLEKCMERGVSSILFSATLLPIQYYKSLLGGNKEDYEIYAESTFDPDKRGLYISNDATSKYTERGIQQYENIAGYIRDVARSKPGNYMAFFPSYVFMKNVVDAYEGLYSADMDVECIMQDDHMSEDEREEFLARFESNPRTDSKSLVGFCVLGGIFSEGIDLKNDSLIGAIIVGTGIPLVCEENELIKDYFDKRDGNGMKYAYIFPGFNKVLQAAGRVIRTHEDVGVVALLDYRFKYSSYRELYPREWSNVKYLESGKTKETLEEFWEKHHE